MASLSTETVDEGDSKQNEFTNSSDDEASPQVHFANAVIASFTQGSG